MQFASFISLDWGVVFQIVNTIVMYLILKKLLFKPVTKFMNDRQESIANSIKEAEETKKEAYALKAEYEAKINASKEEGQEIIKEASRKAEMRADEIIKNAQNEANRLMEKAHIEIEREKQKVVNELKDEISNIAILAASKVIEADIDKNKHEKLISDFIKEVGEATWQN
ncbi:F-type H+-transporting ATPase subunit b [Alkalithermobacter thermoalcaliphilus JW-YL-7 = DSM 7308]|uniref:ATP synthase subunit b, sodium ion specific n=2 Tax=Clostridium paradoxum TaxID=29346 RepID=ATPF_CLOPD|nr:RecName: Full=ATP synthase subunit b, sodium ion specific; AltName: Full=ATP synthase F(0) sector subunit b; AltName: Full=ATPase subunit I; AltName: Full=F-type ATPase subunit b; Short=F-ATPase subunit b [[Clostridium] paradoxum]ABB13422.1 ATP synthase subunit b [[Clostridium] paradoxum] [[Clostridium] paradoxum JW-YL-7 = DSM 7308]KXZ40526.1 ATP synthase subunit b [[Clostridium] paradoxum JW-YL-7 = DSM 7308]SHK71910.1 F-type H+-transporting ATPase subunit b [[Clostridium] paradoxum JW-YL-7 =